MYINPLRGKMEILKFHNKIHDPQLAHLLDNIIDAVLILKAHLTNSNMDSNSIGGTSFIRVFPKLRQAIDNPG